MNTNPAPNQKLDDAKSFMVGTEMATKGLFQLLIQYESHKLQTLAEIMINAKNKTLANLEIHKANYSSVDTAREVISGSILQIAFVAIKKYPKPNYKSKGALHFESEINRLIRENPTARIKNFVLPEDFCVGRELGDLPIGMIIYAARNHYNHFYEERLRVVNELIFNYLNTLYPNPPNDLSFNIYDNKQYYCYSCLVALGWINSEGQLAYEKYKTDLSNILNIEF